MALYNLARMTTVTTGTGTIALGAAVAGFLSFAGSGVSDATTVTYAIQDGSNSEIGRGVYTASGTTLTRTVLKSTNSDAAISLSGTAQVFITAAAEDLVLTASGGGNAGLASIAGLTTVADRLIYATASDTYALATLTAPGRTLLALADPGADHPMIWDDSASAYVFATLGAGLVISGTEIRATEVFSFAVSDEITDLATGTGKITYRMPYAFTVTDVRASVTTAPTGSVVTVDINDGGTTILSTKITIDATEKTSTTAATPAVISDSALAADAEVTIDIDAIGSSVAGAGLKVSIVGYRP